MRFISSLGVLSRPERGYMTDRLYTIRELIFEAIVAIMKIHNQHKGFKSCDCQNILNQLNEYAEMFDFQRAKVAFKK